jgi:hypothetical protein
MPRQKRIEHAGAIYHVLSRGTAGRRSFWMTWTSRISSRPFGPCPRRANGRGRKALVARPLEPVGMAEGGPGAKAQGRRGQGGAGGGVEARDDPDHRASRATPAHEEPEHRKQSSLCMEEKQ